MQTSTSELRLAPAAVLLCLPCPISRCQRRRSSRYSAAAGTTIYHDYRLRPRARRYDCDASSRRLLPEIRILRRLPPTGRGAGVVAVHAAAVFLVTVVVPVAIRGSSVMRTAPATASV